jgi:HemY protein
VAVVVLALAMVAAGGTMFWLRQSRLSRLRAALPAAPVTAPNPALGDLLTGALTAARQTGELADIAALGRLYHANGYATEAAACWRLLATLQPHEARWHYYLADLHRTAGDYAAAEAELEATVGIDSGAATAWLQLAEMKFKSGRHAAAEADYRRRLALVPDDPYAELGLARLSQLQGRTADAHTQLEQILRRDPKFSAAQNLYAEWQAAAGREDLADLHRWLGREAGRFREADDPWMDEVNAACHEAKRLCHLGTIAYQTGRGDLGRARFEHAVAIAPTDPLAYQLLGELQLQSGEAESARQTLARGIATARDIAPTPTHYLKLSEACQKLARASEARQALSDGLGRHPSAAELHHALGNQLAAEGKTGDALASYRRALEFNPSFVDADFAQAMVLLPLGRRQEAAQALRHALLQQPTYPKALLLLARLEIDQGRIESAGQYLLPLLKANPGAPEIRQIVAGWRMQAGQAVEKSDARAAENHYRAGLALQPGHPGLNASLGVHLLITDRAADAVPFLEIYQRAQPANLQAALFLGQAYARTRRTPEARRILTDGLRQAEESGQTTAAGHFREILSALR